MIDCTSGKNVTIPLEVAEHALTLLERYVPSLRDPRHYCTYEDVEVAGWLQAAIQKVNR